ncbi:hypothetical protein [Spiroplasma sp. SV19]|uniref:hypothetical protein n=2 Tax=Spiroplasma sp. SV19 TaxID=2570468 RepID=UPI0024B7C647|nr:hypothetical protein [Spiroplasma sp. SV19]
MKNLHNENKINEFGKGPYFIFANDNELNFITVDIYNDEYDELGNLVKSTFNYDPYNKDDNKVMITETIKIINKKMVQITRDLNLNQDGNITDMYKDNNLWKVYTNLERTQNLEIDFMPIVIIPNPNYEKSARYGSEFASIMDIIAGKIMLDPLLNSGKFTINTNGVTGVVDNEISRMLAAFIENDVLLVEGDPDSNFQPVDYIPGNFKGEQLTRIYDWLLTNYYKMNRHHVPAIAKGAQQTETEVVGVNIQTNAAYEQMIYIREVKLTEFIVKLIKYDNAILNSKTFDLKDIDKLVVDVRLPVNATLERQLNNKENVVKEPKQENNESGEE